MVANRIAFQPKVNPPFPMGKNIVFISEWRNISILSSSEAKKTLGGFSPRF